MTEKRVETPSTIGGTVGAAVAAIASASAEVIVRLHGLDPGGAVDPTIVIAVSAAGAFIGDRIERRRSIRRQIEHLRRRAEIISDSGVRSFVLERLAAAESDWRAGVLTDAAIRDVIIGGVYREYIVPADALAARRVLTAPDDETKNRTS